MNLTDKNYSTYLPQGRLTEAWGVCMSGAGRTRIAPNTSYPPGQHPSDHALNWQRGRVLQAYQIVYISEGAGRFESAATGLRRITLGTAFLLMPGIWHRYEPTLSTGWVEDWIELQGPAVDRLRKARQLVPRRPIFRLGHRPELLELFAQCHAMARATPRGYPPRLAVLGLQILAYVLNAPPMVTGAGRTRLSSGSDADRAIRQAQSRLAEQLAEPPTTDALADEAIMSYSHFRRSFKARAGVTPKQYQMQLRLRAAQSLLSTTNLPLKAIAERLGYHSAFHLSADIRRRTGKPPSAWRQGWPVAD